MSAVLDALSWIMLVAGGAFCVIGGVGLVRLRGFFPRTHAASVIDSAGAGLLLAGMLLQSDSWMVAVKLAAIGMLIFFASPTATHALANAALARGVPLQEPGEGPSKP